MGIEEPLKYSDSFDKIYNKTLNTQLLKFQLSKDRPSDTVLGEIAFRAAVVTKLNFLQEQITAVTEGLREWEKRTLKSAQEKLDSLAQGK